MFTKSQKLTSVCFHMLSFMAATTYHCLHIKILSIWCPSRTIYTTLYMVPKIRFEINIDSGLRVKIYGIECIIYTSSKYQTISNQFMFMKADFWYNIKELRNGYSFHLDLISISTGASKQFYFQSLSDQCHFYYNCGI